MENGILGIMIMPYFLLHDTRHSERLPVTLEGLARHGVTPEIWYASYLPGESVVKAINREHRGIVALAKAEGWDRVCIMEDDLDIVGDWPEFQELVDMGGDITLGGGYQVSEDSAGRVKSWIGMHLYVCHSRFYDTFLASDPEQHIDVAQWGKGIVYHIPVGVQRAGFSLNTRGWADYSKL
jgi:hypothetical protein